jgi:hypothetical protein
MNEEELKKEGEKLRRRFRAHGLWIKFDYFKYKTTDKAARLVVLFKKILARINLELGLAKQLSQTNTPPTTITLSTLRTTAAIFRRAGTLA